MTAARTRKFGLPGAPILVAITAVMALVVGLASAAPAAADSRSAASTVVAAESASTALGDIMKTADLSKFQPGNIISDAAFFNKGTMSEGDIQAFLEKKVPRCQSGYTCLKDWYDTTRTTSADAMCGAYSGGTRERAATIIYKVAQACGINPQVLLVTLQKEQALVTHDWPSDWRYERAMGQGCPDTAGCDVRYLGFFNQVYGAAWQFKRYANPAGTSQFFTWYAPGKTWNLRYHPDASCGSSPVYIQNQATANLYYYTPYQPNAAAIAAGYGDSSAPCVAFGNRNFYNYFTDWFGSTAAPVEPAPRLDSLDSSSYVLALDGSGSLLGYPFAGGKGWGDAVKVGSLAAGTARVLSVGDFDGDGYRDVIGVSTTGGVSLYPGDGARSFGQARSVNVDWSSAVFIANAGDFDGDGVADIFTSDSSGALMLWRGTGAGGFRPPTVAGNGWSSMTFVSGGVDMDKDGATDLIARSSDGRLYLYSGNGSGSWRNAIQIGSGWNGMTSILSPGDFSGDGVPDVLARDAAGALWHYHGTGAGRIAGGNRVGNGWQTMADISGTGPATTSRRVFPAGAGDIDSDRARDVLAVTNAGQLLSYRGDGAGSWRGAITVDANWGLDARLITLGDFSGDGSSDVGRISPDGSFELLRGRGDGTFEAPTRIGNGWAALDVVIGGADFDGDRKIDVLARDSAGNILLYRGNGQGGWLDGGTVVGRGWSSMTAIIYAGDFDGDRRGDLIARSADGGLWLYPTNGGGSFQDPRQIGQGWQGLTALFSPGDFDGDGGADVIARESAGRLLLYRGDGRGGWASSTAIGNGWNGMLQIR